MARRPKPALPLADLLRLAARVRANAHAPYSGFAVGAAVLAGGRTYAACNVENSAYPLSVCAERNAVAMAVAAGAREIDAVAVVSGAEPPAPPCGGCRQVLAEFCSPDAPVSYSSEGGDPIETTVGALLPAAFGRSHLTAAAAGSTGIAPRPPRPAPPGKARSGPPRRGSRRSGRSRSP